MHSKIVIAVALSLTALVVLGCKSDDAPQAVQTSASPPSSPAPSAPATPPSSDATKPTEPPPNAPPKAIPAEVIEPPVAEEPSADDYSFEPAKVGAQFCFERKLADKLTILESTSDCPEELTYINDVKELTLDEWREPPGQEFGPEVAIEFVAAYQSPLSGALCCYKQVFYE